MLFSVKEVRVVFAVFISDKEYYISIYSPGQAKK